MEGADQTTSQTENAEDDLWNTDFQRWMEVWGVI